jgi:hypothetical protein
VGESTVKVQWLTADALRYLMATKARTVTQRKLRGLRLPVQFWFLNTPGQILLVIAADLFEPPDDARFVQVVGRHFHFHAVTGPLGEPSVCASCRSEWRAPDACCSVRRGT